MRRQLFCILLLLCCTNSAAQELTGPDRTLPGTLASFEIVPPQEASWHVVAPDPNMETYKIDTGSSTLYFASPEPGHYTIIAGIIVEGKSQFLIKAFINGEEDERPPPIPAPPVSSLETWVKTQTQVLVNSKNLASESILVAECIALIVRRIDEGNIKTAQNARTQLQIALTATLAQASPTAVTDWMPFLAELSRQLETELGEKIDDLAEVKKVIQNVSNALKSLELPKSVTTPLQNIDDPRIRTRQTRIFRNLLSN